MLLRQIYDPQLAQYSYLIGCQATGEALIIDPERDIDRYKLIAKDNGMRITAVTETHIHADFVSGAREFATDPSIHLYLSSEGGEDWSYTWPKERPNTHYIKDGDHFMVGKIRIDVISTPGHTPEHLIFLISCPQKEVLEPIALATGDFIFVGDVGRPDLLESALGIPEVKEKCAEALYSSLKNKLEKYPDYLQILPGHGAGSHCGRALGSIPISTLGYERHFNEPLKLAVQGDKKHFIDAVLSGQPSPPSYFSTMKLFNRDGAPITKGVPLPSQANAKDFAKNVSLSKGKILDTRDNVEHFNAAHFKGAISAPLSSSFFSNSAGSYLHASDAIFLVVDRPEDVDVAAKQLYRIGFDNLILWTTVQELKDEGLLNEANPSTAAITFDPNKALQEGFVLDVRNPEEYSTKHIPGAVNIPYTKVMDRINEIPKDKKIYVHCASGKRATLASSFLHANNYDTTLVYGSIPALKKS